MNNKFLMLNTYLKNVDYHKVGILVHGIESNKLEIAILKK